MTNSTNSGREKLHVLPQGTMELFKNVFSLFIIGHALQFISVHNHRQLSTLRRTDEREASRVPISSWWICSSNNRTEELGFMDEVDENPLGHSCPQLYLMELVVMDQD